MYGRNLVNCSIVFLCVGARRCRFQGDISDYLSSRKARDRAEECRVIARTFSDTETRDRMLGIATEYDRLAEQIDQSDTIAK